MLKYFSIIISFSLFETSKDLMAGFDNENGNSEECGEGVLTTPIALHFGSRFSDRGNWMSSYDTVNEGEPLGLPVWTRVPSSSYQVQQHLKRRVLQENEEHLPRASAYFKSATKKIRSILSFKKAPDSNS